MQTSIYYLCFTKRLSSNFRKKYYKYVFNINILIFNFSNILNWFYLHTQHKDCEKQELYLQ